MKGFVLLLLFVIGTFALELTPIAKRHPSKSGAWTVTRDALPDEQISFKVLLKQRNLYLLEKIFWEVSDPQHANYGKFLSREEVKALIAPEPQSMQRSYLACIICNLI